jgi:acyl-CoA reductase-like NAD-dependent aldehyde dehydrogenase
VTAKEQLLTEAPDFTEAQAKRALHAAHDETAQDTADEWGDLDAHMRAAMRRSLRELDEEEAAAGFAPWKPEDR